MGSEDEFGKDYHAKDIMNDKLPINFHLDMPTDVKYLDPIFYAHNVSIDYLLSRQLKNQLYPFPREKDFEILFKWVKYHNYQNIFDILE